MLIGYAAIHLSRAGEGVHLPPASAAQALNVSPHSATQLITDIFPENIAKSVAEGQVLQIVVFSVLFAMALILVPEAKRRPMLVLSESLSETMFKFTNLVMYAAPLGVFGAVAYTVGHLGVGVLLPLLKLLATMYAALAFFIVCVLLPIALWARIPIKRFVNTVAEPVTIGFATASSEATLPRAIEQLESFGVPREIVAFVLPTGYSFNMDGASLYQSLALFFVVQAAGLHLSAGQQVLMILTLLISSKGTAGVARASLLIVFGAATSFHLPMEPLFLLFAIDQLMDMGRTAVTLFVLLSTITIPANDKHDKRASLSASVVSARTVYVDNQTTTAELQNTAYTELSKWGRLQIVDTPQKADIVLRLSNGNYVKFVPGGENPQASKPKTDNQNVASADEAVPPGST